MLGDLAGFASLFDCAPVGRASGSVVAQSQDKDEKMDNYIIRIKKMAILCEYSDYRQRWRDVIRQHPGHSHG